MFIPISPQLLKKMNILKSLNYIPIKRYNPETLDFRDRILANGGAISDSSVDAIEKFVQDCKNALLWDKLLEVAPFLGTNLNAALVKLVYPAGAPGVITNVNFVSGDYAETGANGGLLGDGATKYLNTGFNAQSYLPDNAHLSFYLREDVGAAGNRGLLGAINGTDQYWLGSLTPASQVNVRLGQTASATLAASLSKGFYIGTRTGASQLRLYKNGVLAATDGSTVVHARPNLNLYAFGWNAGGAAGGHVPGRGSFYSVGQALNGTEASALNDAVQTLQRNLNRDIA
jgi:hypothetical protein